MVKPDILSFRRGSVTWIDDTSPVPDTHRCCIQCGKITPEMQRRSTKLSIPKTPKGRFHPYTAATSLT